MNSPLSAERGIGMNVHNHGPEESAGVLCGEQLVGQCQLAALRDVLDRVAPEGGMFAPDNDSCVWCGVVYPGFNPADCKHAADCAWVAARAALEGQ